MSPPPPSDRRTVLVTGAGGFVGRHLVASQLGLGRRVIATDLDLEALDPLEGHACLRLLPGDIADPELQAHASTHVDTVFHLAATHLSLIAGPSEYVRVNVEAVRSLVRRCKEAEVRRFVHCSTVGVYGALAAQPADETTMCRPEFVYEKTKLEGERVVLEAARSGGFGAVVLRPAWVYGPGCPRTEKLFRAIGKGRFVVAGRGDTFRHGVYIRDVTQAFELAANVPEAVGEIFVIADDQAVTIGDLVRRIADLTGAKPPRHVPFALLHGVATVAELAFGLVGKDPPLSRRTLRFFSGNTSFRTEKASSMLGFRPHYSLDQGLAESHAILDAGRFWDVPLGRTDSRQE
jgi:dihydroflavonol-4-reductase